ncbi:MAG: hypothetical protein ACD_25C00190G0001, partial [uncultured bacterium]
MFSRGSAFPGFNSASGPETTSMPMAKPSGASIYLFSPSIKLIKAMSEPLLGSYSIEATFAGMNSLFLLKSMTLYLFFVPLSLYL